MKTPTITRVSLEPFCPTCGRGLEMQEDVRMVHDKDTDELLGFMILCPGCERVLRTSEVEWRERKNDNIE